MRAVWVSTDPRGRGGVPTYVDTLSRTRLWTGWSVVHVSTHEEGTPAHRIAVAARGVFRLARVLLRERPDLAHVHTASGASFLRKAVVCGLCTAAGVPVVLHVHSGRFGTFARSAPGPLRRLVVATLSRAAVVVAVSEPLATSLRAVAPTARVVTVPNPVRPAARTRDTTGPRQVVFAGRVDAAKGTFVLLEAWAMLPAPVRDGARLVVLGAGDLDGARDRTDRLGIGSTCDIRGWVPHPEATATIAESDVLVLVSRAEGQPLAVLEAMAAGTCVVAAPVGGIPDLVEHGRTGLLVAPDTPEALVRALEVVLTDAGLTARLGAAARERVRGSHDVEVVVDRLDALYRRVVAGRADRERVR